MLDGRIIKGIGGLYTVATSNGNYECSVRGIFRNKNINPTIGDYVKIEISDEQNKKGSIDEINERKNFLIRPRVSNIDQAIIVFSIVSPKINVDILDKFLVMAERGNFQAVICLNKIDLIEEKDYINLKKLYEKVGYKVICLSTLKEENFDELKLLLKNKVSVFAGPSGVGKSSIINKILPFANMEIGEISAKIQRGKHTTRHSELMEIDKDSFIVDSPGFTTLTIDDIPKDELSKCFIEFKNYSEKCRFSDCVHLNEPDCNVKQNVGDNISVERYESYTRFLLSKGGF